MPGQDKFRASMKDHGIPEDVIGQVNAGYEEMTNKSPKIVHAEFFKRATDLFDELVPPDTANRFYEWNACCKNGSRYKASKAFYARYKDLPLKEKLEKIPDVPYMGKPVLNDDGTITIHAVSFWENGKFVCACPNFHGSGLTAPVSRTYCRCCGGHFKYHYQIMLGVKLNVLEVVSSPLDSEGKNPCVFRMEIVSK